MGLAFAWERRACHARRDMEAIEKDLLFQTGVDFGLARRRRGAAHVSKKTEAYI